MTVGEGEYYLEIARKARISVQVWVEESEVRSVVIGRILVQ
jgi:hypothetical protein